MPRPGETSNPVSDTAPTSYTTAGTAPLRRGPARVQDQRIRCSRWTGLDVQDHRNTQFTPEKRNYRYALRGRLADGQEYALFLSLRRSSVAGYDLHMTVESAYAVPAGSRGRPPGEIRFGVLAVKTMRGEVISFPPRR